LGRVKLLAQKNWARPVCYAGAVALDGPAMPDAIFLLFLIVFFLFFGQVGLSFSFDLIMYMLDFYLGKTYYDLLLLLFICISARSATSS